MVVKWLLFLFAVPIVFIPNVYASLRELWGANDFSVTERTMKSILESCYENDNLSNPIIIFGDSNQFIDKSSIIRINGNLNIGKSQLPHSNPTTVILVTDSPKELQSNLMLLKKTKSWNHMASFFILGKNEGSCSTFMGILIRTRKMDIINSIYICPESMNTAALYTWNPITDYAPYPWEKMENPYNINIFRQIFYSNISCNNLNYDKTKFLNGYQIVIRMWPRGRRFLPGENYFFALRESHPVPKLFRSIVTGLNASGWLEISGTKDSTIESLSAGTSDIALEMLPSEEYPRMKSLFPYHHDRIVAIVKSSPEESTLHKIFHLWSPPVLILAFIALAILCSILTIKSHDISAAILDLTRLLIYTSILIDIRSHSFRIFFTTVLIMMIISNGVFQGIIAAFLTKQERNEPIKTIDTLLQLGYKFYTIPELKTSIELKCPKCHPIPVSQQACMDYVLNGTRIACLEQEYVYQENALLPLELVQEPLRQIVASHKCRDNWVLYERFNSMWIRIIESGLWDFWKVTSTYDEMHKRQLHDIELSSPQYRPVRLYKLDFAFKLLAVGLSLSTIVFFLELLVVKYGIPLKKS